MFPEVQREHTDTGIFRFPRTAWSKVSIAAGWAEQEAQLVLEAVQAEMLVHPLRGEGAAKEGTLPLWEAAAEVVGAARLTVRGAPVELA
jgi:uncharacterized Fe-S cluster-containing protein